MKANALLSLPAIAIAWSAVILAGDTSLSAGGLRDVLPGQTGCQLCCPACDHVCRFDAERVEEEIDCFEVKSEVICIPRVVFPWQHHARGGNCACDNDGCSECRHNGARTRRVCRLQFESYTCPQCEYSWTAERRSGPCDDCCDTFSTQPESDTPTPYDTLSPNQPLSYPEPRRLPVPTPSPLAPQAADRELAAPTPETASSPQRLTPASPEPPTTPESAAEPAESSESVAPPQQPEDTDSSLDRAAARWRAWTGWIGRLL